MLANKIKRRLLSFTVVFSFYYGRKTFRVYDRVLFTFMENINVYFYGDLINSLDRSVLFCLRCGFLTQLLFFAGFNPALKLYYCGK